jgi:hypothetical protein
MLASDLQAARQRPTETGRSAKTHRMGLFIALPCLVILLNVIVWITAVSQSGFWADDFLWVTHFSRSIGDLSNYRFDVGKYVINIFWAIGTEAFGAGSVVPFLVLNSLVFTTGVVLWLWVGTRQSWGSVGAWWIGGLFIASEAWLPTTLWASNITHSGGFLALGLGISAHRRAMRSRNLRDGACWAVASGAAWTFAIMSNLLYIGLMIIAVYCAWYQIGKLRQLGMASAMAACIVGFWNLLLPILYFVAIGYPGTTASQPYSVTGLRFVHDNLRFYRMILAPSDLLTAIYVALLAAAIVGALVAVRRSRDFFPIAVLCAAGATAVPALVQSQQRDVHYMAMPLLLLFSALAAGVYPIPINRYRRWMAVGLLAAIATLVLVFIQGSELRSYFVRTPYGSSLRTFRSEVASLIPEGGRVCVKMNLAPPQQALLIAEMSGQDGFLVPPISAAQAYLVTGSESCPAVGPLAHIGVGLNARGDFVATS